MLEMFENSPMKKIALYGKIIDPSWYPRLGILLNALSCYEVELLCCGELQAVLQEAGLMMESIRKVDDPAQLPDDTDLFLTLGGDGTFLSALTWVRDRCIPVAGINFGHLGFLTTVPIEHTGEDLSWMEDLLKGNYREDDRFVLQLSVSKEFPPIYPFALNEISLQRYQPQLMGVYLTIDDAELPPFQADGLLISTSTGSTAYSLSVGGPILLPGTPGIILSPIAPHNLNVRPLIVPNTSRIRVRIKTRSGAGSVTLTVDNRSVEFPSDAELCVTRAPFPLRRVSLSGDEFISALQEKLFWGIDRRNYTND